MKSNHRESNSFEARGRAKRIEQLADNFAAALLMPSQSLDKLIDPRRCADIDHLADVAAELRVCPMALAWRLYNIKRIDAATRDALRKERQRFCVSRKPKRFSYTFISMLHAAIDRGELSARKAAKAMGMSLPMLSDLFAEHSLPVPFEL